jgi:hypothetical protein
MGNGSLIPVSKPETYCELSRVERVGGSARLTPADAGAALRLFRGGLWALALSAILCGCGTMVQSPSYYPPVTPRPAAAAPSGASHIVRASWYGPGFDAAHYQRRSLQQAQFDRCIQDFAPGIAGSGNRPFNGPLSCRQSQRPRAICQGAKPGPVRGRGQKDWRCGRREG